jgi:hypothetical protein
MVMALDHASAGSASDARAHLRQYYADVGPEQRALLTFLVRAFRGVPPDSLVLNFGSGPALSPLITAAAHVHEIHVADPEAANLAEVRRWLLDQRSAWDWTEFVAAALCLEGGREGLSRRVLKREGMIRKCVTRLLRGNLRRRPPIDQPRPYDVLAAHLWATSAPEGPVEWRCAVGNLGALLKPGGRLVMSAWEGAAQRPGGSIGPPRESTGEGDARDALVAAGFVPETIRTERVTAVVPSS